MRKLGAIVFSLLIVSTILTSCIKVTTLSDENSDVKIINNDSDEAINDNEAETINNDVEETTNDEVEEAINNESDDTKNSDVDNIEIMDEAETTNAEKVEMVNDAEAKSESVDDGLDLFKMSREEQIAFLKPYILAFEDDVSFLAEHSKESHIPLYEAGLDIYGYINAEIKHLVKCQAPYMDNDYIDNEWVSIVTLGDWHCEYYESGKYTVSGQLFNIKGESIGDKPWKVGNSTLYPVTDVRFKSIADIEAYYRSHISEDLIAGYKIIESIHDGYKTFEGKLYSEFGAKGYPSFNVGFDNAEIEVTGKRSCVVTLREYWEDIHLCDYIYGFEERNGVFLLVEKHNHLIEH